MRLTESRTDESGYNRTQANNHPAHRKLGDSAAPKRIIRRARQTTLLLAGLGCLGPASANLIINGNFQSGNTGFESQYDYKDPDTVGGPGQPVLDATQYTVAPTAFSVHSSWSNTPDHTTGSATTGLYFIANGSTDPRNIVWQTLDAIIIDQANTAYRFEGYITSVFTVAAPGAPGPKLTFQVGNGDDWFDMGTTETFPNGYIPGSWRLSFYDGVFAQTGSYYLRLLNAESAGGGNDLGIDDLYFGLRSQAPSEPGNPGDPNPPSIPVAPVPAPATALLFAVAPLAAWLTRRRRRPARS